MTQTEIQKGDVVKLRHGELDGPEPRSTLRVRGARAEVVRGRHREHDESGEATGRECVVVRPYLRGDTPESGPRGQPLQVPVDYCQEPLNRRVRRAARKVFGVGGGMSQERWDAIFGRKTEKEPA